MLSGRQFSIFLLIAVCFLIVFFLDTWAGVKSIRYGYEIVSAEDKARKLTDIHKKLTIEYSRLISPVRLAPKAKMEFGLVTPGPSQIIVVP